MHVSRRARVRPLTFAGGLCVLSALAAVASSSEPSGGLPIPQWIAELDSGDYATRLEATQKLIAAGRPAVAALVETAKSGSPEASVRAITALESIYRDEDLEAAEEAEDALEALAASKVRTAAVRAGEALAANYEFRRERALAQIERLGGVIVWSNRVVLQPGVVMARPDGRGIAHIVLGKSWKGGDEGIKYIKRVEDLPMLYIAKGPGYSPISADAEREIQEALPRLSVQERGLAFLGISGHPDPNGGCMVLAVTPGAAADKAGLREGDVVRSFNGKPVDDFQTLIDFIAEKEPGDNVPVAISRNGETVELAVELGEWSDAGRQ